MADSAPLQETSAALQAVIASLRAAGYDFATPTPETHARVLARPDKVRARDCRDVLGWSLPFSPDVLEPELLARLREAGVVEETAGGLRCTVRAASLDGDVYLHSAYPPTAADSVFFGPDTYRFASFLRAQLQDAPAIGVLVDMGAGSGAGAVVAARLVAPARIVLTDINPKAIRFAEVNLAAAGVSAEYRCGRGLAGLTGPVDLIIANPPFICDEAERIYRSGGDLYGARLSLDWAREGAGALAPGGRMLLYTGAAVVGGRDVLLPALRAALDGGGFDVSYSEIDPDIHGDTLSLPAYRDVERIAAVGAIILRHGAT
jgi:methylase of polypeptide subunit release factors